MTSVGPERAPIQPMFSETELDVFHKAVELERGFRQRLKGFSLEQLTRLDDFITELEQERES